jgi:hypothetical protein
METKGKEPWYLQRPHPAITQRLEDITISSMDLLNKERDGTVARHIGEFRDYTEENYKKLIRVSNLMHEIALLDNEFGGLSKPISDWAGRGCTPATLTKIARTIMDETRKTLEIHDILGAPVPEWVKLLRNNV